VYRGSDGERDQPEQHDGHDQHQPFQRIEAEQSMLA